MTHIIQRLIEKRLPEWNRRILTMADFERICARERVIFVESENRKFAGEYIPFENRNMIILRRGLAPGLRKWIAFHELGHHLLHQAPHHFSRSITRKIDGQANLFAAVAILPTFVFRRGDARHFSKKFPKELLKIRQEILEEYRI